MTQSPPTPTPSRRDFLKTIWAVFGGIAALETLGVFLAYLQPRLAEGEFGSLIPVGTLEEFPAGSVTHILNGRFYLVRLPDGGLLAIYHRCTHLGCTVSWETDTQTFFCPCHGSRFDQNGVVENPPAPRPLDIFPVLVQDGQILVNTGDLQTRQGFETAQVTYP